MFFATRMGAILNGIEIGAAACHFHVQSNSSKRLDWSELDVPLEARQDLELSKDNAFQ